MHMVRPHVPDEIANGARGRRQRILALHVVNEAERILLYVDLDQFVKGRVIEIIEDRKVFLGSQKIIQNSFFHGEHSFSAFTEIR